MIKVYVPNISNSKIGGGFTFLANLIKGLEGRVQFVHTWQECDIVFVFGITTMDKDEINTAIKAGKKFILRVDNIPRKSRNKRQSPAERLAEFGKKADKVVYQSQWCVDYAGYFAGEGIIINNGVDKSIFNHNRTEQAGKTFLYLNYNDNPNKRFDEALYHFDMIWRRDNECKLVIAGNVPKIYLEHPEYNWDIPTNAPVEYVGILETKEAVAKVMKQADFLLCPYFAEASSNVLLEGLACGLMPIGINEIGGNIEIIERWDNDIIVSIEDMGNEYLKVFEEVLKVVDN